MEIKTLKCYKTSKSKRGNIITSDFNIIDSTVVNGRIQVEVDGTVYWVSLEDVLPSNNNENTVDNESKQYIHHVVKWGETIDQIARHYELTTSQFNALVAQYPSRPAAGSRITIVK